MKQIAPIVIIVVFMSSCVLLCGCSTTPAWGNKSDNPFHDTFGGKSRIQFEHVFDNHMVNVVRIDSDRVGNDLLKVTLTLRNTTKSDLWVDIRTAFLDEQGHELEKTNWEPIGIEKRTVAEYTCTSLSNQAMDYQILIYNVRKN